MSLAWDAMWSKVRLYSNNRIFVSSATYLYGNNYYLICMHRYMLTICIYLLTHIIYSIWNSSRCKNLYFFFFIIVKIGWLYYVNNSHIYVYIYLERERKSGHLTSVFSVLISPAAAAKIIKNASVSINILLTYLVCVKLLSCQGGNCKLSSCCNILHAGFPFMSTHVLFRHYYMCMRSERLILMMIAHAFVLMEPTCSEPAL